MYNLPNLKTIIAKLKVSRYKTQLRQYLLIYKILSFNFIRNHAFLAAKNNDLCLLGIIVQYKYTRIFKFLGIMNEGFLGRSLVSGG